MSSSTFTHSSRLYRLFTDTLTEADLAEAAFAEEVVVILPQPDSSGLEPRHGIIVGYEDPGANGEPGRFVIDPVKQTDRGWVENGEPTERWPRDRVTVLGPAYREPGDRETELTPEGWELIQGGQGRLEEGTDAGVSVHPAMAPFLRAFYELLNADRPYDTGKAFNVRLDARVLRGEPNERHYKVLVRAVEDPMLHDEIALVMQIASRNELAVSHSNVGLEVHFPGDVG